MTSLRHTKEIVNERLSCRGIELIGDYVNANTKTEFQCNCDHKWTTTPGSIMSGRGCPKCALITRSSNLRILSTDVVNQRFSDAERLISMIDEYSGYHSKSRFKCHHCENIWTTTPGSVISGKGCPKCAIKTNTDRQRISEVAINERISDRGIRLISGYINTNSKAGFECRCGNKWSASPTSIMRGQGCPKCAGYGFNSGKSSWVYVLDYTDYIKYGITNDLDRRLYEHGKHNTFILSYSKLCEDGIIAQKIEREIKKLFGGRFISKEIMPNGWTETLPHDKLQSLLDFLSPEESLT